MTTEIVHHTAAVNGTELHHVSAGDDGTPVLLVHGFPETWWAFHRVIPLLAEHHRVFAVDLRGFGDSANGEGAYDSATSAEDLHQLIEHLDVGSVHLVGQDISGGAVFRLAANHPEQIRSVTAIEMGLAGFGLEGLADVTHGGSWHIGMLAALGVPELLLKGREREFLRDLMFAPMTASEDAVTDTDLDEFVRTYARDNGFRGAEGLYRSMLSEGEELKAIAAERPLQMPTLAFGAGGGPFTAATLKAVTTNAPREVQLDGVGHYAALEAPDQVSAALLDFFAAVDVTG